MSGYFECVCCGTVDMGETGDPALCDVCKVCECSADECNCRECVVDGCHGIYAPQMFAKRFENSLRAALDDQTIVDTLLKGPHEEYYDEAWGEVEGYVELTIDGKRWGIEQDGDIFLRRMSA